MKIPPELNLVRFTGFGAGAFVPTPKGFERADRLPGDHQAYAVRRGYRLERCSGAHGFDRGCPRCLPFHGAVAVQRHWGAHPVFDRNNWRMAAYALEQWPPGTIGARIARAAAEAWQLRAPRLQARSLIARRAQRGGWS